MTASFPENVTTRKKVVAICSKCKSVLDSRARRGWFVKMVLFWLPLKKYRCYKCKRTQYVLADR